MKTHKLLIVVIIFVILDIIVSFIIYTQFDHTSSAVNAVITSITNVVQNKHTVTVKVVTDIPGIKITAVNNSNILTSLINIGLLKDSSIALHDKNGTLIRGPVSQITIHLSKNIQPDGKIYLADLIKSHDLIVAHPSPLYPQVLFGYTDIYNASQKSFDLYVYTSNVLDISRPKTLEIPFQDTILYAAASLTSPQSSDSSSEYKLFKTMAQKYGNYGTIGRNQFFTISKL